MALMAMAAAMAPTAVVPTITVDTAVPAMKRCQLDSRLAAVASIRHSITAAGSP